MLSKSHFVSSCILLCISSIFAIPPLQFETNPYRFSHFDEVRAQEQEQSIISPRFRLPGVVVPRYYKLQIRPILIANDTEAAQFTVPGNVLITTECMQVGSVITMHAAELIVNETSVKVTRTNDPEQTPLPILRHVFNNDTEIQSYEILLEETLVVGEQYDVYIEFVSQIASPDDRMNGIYRSSYLDDNGEIRLVATTQFSRTRSVRKVFPSFDEPNQKAIFEFTIGRTDDYHTLSNMEINDRQPIEGLDGWTWDFYDPTPVMPITVIAFVISDFESETAPDDIFEGKPVNVWVPPPMLRNNGAVWSAEAVAKTLKHFEEIFNITYELPKIDSVGMPDFAAGAMENWGLNIYRTAYLTWYQGESTAAAKYSSGSVISHELAHQYWGNLVTHEWWNDWWITEGFASYYEYIGFDATNTEGFEILNRIVCDDLQPALEFDAGPGSVPMHGPISDQFIENPSAINYQRGASIIRMMQGFLTEETFIEGLKFYLNKRNHTAVDQYALFEDLTTYLESSNQSNKTNGKTMTEILDTWTLQKGFPLVRVSRAGASRIFVSQERFQKFSASSSNSNAKDLEPNDLWYVPIGYVDGSNPSFDESNLTPKLWIDKTMALISHSFNTSHWLVLNGDARGYYRVLYDDHFETLLKAELEANHTGISTASRSQLVDNYFVLAYERYVGIERALDMTRFLREETDYVVWISAFRQLRKCLLLFSSLANTTSLEQFKTYMRTNLQPSITLLGEQLPTETPDRTIFRVPVLDWACTVGDGDSIAYANRLMSEWQAEADPSETNRIPVDIQATVYCTAIASRTGDDYAETWEFVLTQYNATNLLLLNALACTNVEADLTSILNMAIQNGTDIPQAHAVQAIQRVAMNSLGRNLVINFLQSNITDIITHTGTASSIASIVSTLSSYIATNAEKLILQDIIQTNADLFSDQIMASLNSSLANIDTNIEWISTFGARFTTWFEAYNNGSTTSLLV